MKIRFLLFFILGSLSLEAQMIKGYFPSYRSTAYADQVQYDKITDLIYSFGDVSSTGTISIQNMALFNYVRTKCTTNGVRLWVALGGWGNSGTFSGVAANATYRNNLAASCLNLCTTYGLEGIDIDWEFPGAGDKTNYTAMLAAIKGSFGTSYKLSAALGGESFTYSCVNKGHAVGVEAAAFTYLDYFNIMSYDAPSCFSNHTSLDFMQRSMDGWNALGCPYSKMIPGMAFYTRGSAVDMWSSVATTSRFNDADGIDGSLNFDSKPTIEAKVNWAMCVKGAPGVMVWELSQDLPGTNPLNLTTVMANAANACGCPFSDPNLGADQSLCGTSSVTLNSGLSASSGRTFSWTRNGSAISGSGPSLVVSTAGTYKVTVTEGSCTKNDEVVVTATLPVPDLSAFHGKVICDPAFYNLQAANAAVFPSGTTWQWSHSGLNITGATASSLANVRTAGTYRLTASVSGCGSQYSEAVLTSSLPTPVDGCNSAAGPVNLSITNATGGPYTWYSSATGGTALATGTSYTTPSIASTTTYYVQDGATTSYSAGLNGPANSFQNPPGDGIGLNFTAAASSNIASVDVFVPAGGSVTGLAVKIWNASGSTLLYTSPAINYSNSGAMARVTVPVNYTVAAGSYRLSLTATSGNLHVSTAPSYPLTSGDISITGGYGLGSYNFAFNWQIGGSSSCDRLPVVANIGGSCTLPVTLIDFGAVQDGSSVVVYWKTVEEIDNDYYLVERSQDGQSFTSIARINGKGTTQSLSEYSYRDAGTPTGHLYYRLKQVDKDGTVHFSSVVRVSTAPADVFRIAPNPFSTSTLLVPEGFRGEESTVLTVQVMNLEGRVLETHNGILSSEGFEIGAALPSGMYLLKVMGGSTLMTYRIVKQ